MIRRRRSSKPQSAVVLCWALVSAGCVGLASGFQSVLLGRRSTAPFSTVSVRSSTRLSISVLNQLFAPSKPSTTAATSPLLLQDFVTQWNSQSQPTGSSIDSLLGLFADDVVWNDYRFAKSCNDKLELERRLRLQRDALWPTLVLDETSVVVDKANQKLAFLFQYDGSPLRGCAFMTLTDDQSHIQTVDWVMEGTSKGGEASLRLLTLASKVIGSSGSNSDGGAMKKMTSRSSNPKLTAPELYFDAWNRRDMGAAVELFADDVVYDDTAFPNPFSGKQNLRNHLLLVADAFPPSFEFIVDDLAINGKRLAVRWHVENNGKLLPFTEGCSIYKLNSANKITSGIDFVAPGPFKPGGVTLLADTIKTAIQREPLRLIPAATWLAYMYIVFFSDGILPGANALALEQRTWEEVINLSLNFFLVSPLLHLPFSPVVHPMLEGVFNLLLAWAAMFAGFLSDDRRDKPNLFPMLPAVAGMQFLTSAFLLPYLVTRSTETQSPVSKNELGMVAQACESPLLGLTMGAVGAGSIAWFLYGRLAEFGPFADRWLSFLDLLSIDRVGSSFIVDLVIFGLFQGWLVDDDLKRRGLASDNVMSLLAKYVPFVGLAVYLTLRPPLEEESQKV